MKNIFTSIFRKSGLATPLRLALLFIAVFFSGTPSTHGAAGDIVGTPARDAVSGRQEAVASVSDSAGNIIITGYSTASGTDRIYTVKFDPSGNVIWTAEYDSGTNPGRGVSVVVDRNAGDTVVVAGYVYDAAAAKSRIRVIKYTAAGSGGNGVEVWNAPFEHGSKSVYPSTNALAIAGSGDTAAIYVGGYLSATGNQDYLVVKFSGTGATPWPGGYRSESEGYAGNERVEAVDAGPGGVAVTGQFNGDIVTIKYDADGNRAWGATEGGTEADSGKAVKMDGAGNVIMAGYYGNGARKKDIYLVKYASDYGTSGTKATYTHDSINHGDDVPHALSLDGAGNVYVAGQTYSYASGEDFFTAKFDSNLAAVWPSPAVYNSSGGETDIATSLTVDQSTGDIYVSGYTWGTNPKDFRIVKYAANGNYLWSASYDKAGHDDVPVGAWFSASDLHVAGFADQWTAGASDHDFVVVKYDAGSLNRPTNLKARATANTNIQLTWDDNSGAPNNEARFKIERKLGLAGNWSNLVPSPFISQGQTTYDDGTVVTNNKYYYRVYACQDADCTVLTDPSETASAIALVVNEATPPEADVAVYDHQYSEDGGQTLISGDDFATGIATGPSDNHPVVTGYSVEDYGMYYEYCTIKYNRDTMAPLWSQPKRVGQSTTVNKAEVVVVESDNNPIVTGDAKLVESATNWNISLDIFTRKYSADGNEVKWSTQYSGPRGGTDHVVAMVKDTNNNIAVAGNSENVKMLTRLEGPYSATQTSASSVVDENRTTWTPGQFRDYYVRILTGENAGQIRPIADNTTTELTVNVNFANGFGVSAGDQYEIWSGRTDNDIAVARYPGTDVDPMTPTWTLTPPYDGGSQDYVTAAAFDQSGNVFVTGYTYSTSNSNFDVFIAKYSSAGSSGQASLLWSAPVVYNGPANRDDRATSIAVDAAGNAYVTGSVMNSEGKREIAIFKFRGSDGSMLPIDTQWANNPVIVDSAVYGEGGGDIIKVVPSTGEIVVAGTIRAADGLNDFYVTKLDRYGAVRYPEAIPVLQRANIDDEVMSMELDNNGNVYIAGNTTNGSNTDILLAVYNYEMTIRGLVKYDRAACTQGLDTVIANDMSAGLAINNLGEAFVAGNTSTNCTARGDGAWDYVVFKRPGDTLQPPSAFTPTAQTDTVSPHTKVLLNWMNNNPSGSTTLNIRRLQTNTCPLEDDPAWDTACIVANALADNGGAQSHTDNNSCSGLSPNTHYCYMIKAVPTSAAVESVGVPATVRTLLAPLAPPSTPVVTGATTSSASLQWSAVADAAGYKVERGTGFTASCSNPTQVKTDSSAICSETICTFADDTPALAPGTQYCYRIRTKNADGVYSVSYATADSWTVPASPAWPGTPVYNITTTAMRIDWNDVTGASKYLVTRSPAFPVNPVEIAVPTSYYDDSGLDPGTNYTYTVKAITADNRESAASTGVSGTTRIPVPGNFSITLNPPTTANITWDPVPGATSYTLYYAACRKEDPAGCSATSGNTWDEWYNWSSKSVSSPTNETLSAGTKHRYYLVAVKSSPAASSDATATLTTVSQITTAPSPTVTEGNISNNNFTVTWPTVFGARYEVKWGTASGLYTGSSGTVNYGILSHPTPTNLTPGATYYYVVTAKGDSVGNELTSAEKTVTTRVDPPIFTSAETISAGSWTIRFQWQSPASNPGPKDGWEISASEWAGNSNYAVNPPTNSDNSFTSTTWSSTWNDSFATQTGDQFQLDLGITPNTYKAYRFKVRYKYACSPGPCQYSAWSTEYKYAYTPPSKITSHVCSWWSCGPTSTSSIQFDWSTVVGAPTFLIRRLETAGSCPVETDPAWDTATQYGEYARSSQVYTQFVNSTGVEQGKTYCYRIGTKNNSGTTWGFVKSYTAYSAAPATLTLTPVSNTQIDLSWPIVERQNGYYVQRSTDNTVWSDVNSCNPVMTGSCSSSSLSGGTRYYYRVFTRNSANQAVNTINISNNSITKPDKVTWLYTQQKGPQQAEIAWRETFGTLTPAPVVQTNYVLERSEDSGTNWSSLTTQGPFTYETEYCCGAYPNVTCTAYPTTSCSTPTPKMKIYQDTDPNLKPGTNYCYRVTAVNSSGDIGPTSLISGDHCTTTLAVRSPNTMLVSAENSNSRKLNIAWTYDPDSCGGTSCSDPDGFSLEVQLGGGSWYTVKTIVFETGIYSYTYSDGPKGMDPETEYTYRIRSYKGSDYSPYTTASGRTGSWIANQDSYKTISVILSGQGTGTVTSSPGGIECGADCRESYNSATSVTLTAVPASGSFFSGWSGACSGTGQCILTPSTDKNVTAVFQLQ